MNSNQTLSADEIRLELPAAASPVASSPGSSISPMIM